MDLLTGSLRRHGTAAVLLAAAVLSCGCEQDEGDGAGPATGPTTTVPTASLALPDIEQVRPDEVPVGDRDGVGSATEVVKGTSDDVVVVYGVCSEESEEMTLRLALPRPEPLVVPCDGVVSRTQVFTDAGEAFGVDVGVAAGVEWRVLVSTRSE